MLKIIRRLLTTSSQKGEISTYFTDENGLELLYGFLPLIVVTIFIMLCTYILISPRSIKEQMQKPFVVGCITFLTIDLILIVIFPDITLAIIKALFKNQLSKGAYLMSIIEKLKAVFSSKPLDQKNKKGFNPVFLSQIQPQGGIRFEPNYVQLGNGYVTCLHVYKYQTDVNDFWLEPIMNMPNVICTLDAISPNKSELVESINRGMTEQSVRFDDAKSSVERKDAQRTYQELDELYDDVSVGEILKTVHLRLFVKATTLDELEIETRKVMDELESMNFRSAIFLNEQEWEWQSLFTSFTTQLTYVNKRKGKEIPSRSLAGGYPFYYTNLLDPFGTYLGTTTTGGTVLFDLFHKDKYRKFYNALMIGVMGSGKSTLLKKELLERAIRGDKVRAIDATGEFTELVLGLGGKEIALDGTMGIINPLQVYKTAVKADGTTDHEISFMQHLSKMKIFYGFLKPSASDEEKEMFASLLTNLYVVKGLWSGDPENIYPIANTVSEDFPIFSDYLSLVRKELYTDDTLLTLRETLSEHSRNLLSSIELTVKNLCNIHGKIFNGKSSINNFDDEQIISFSIRSLRHMEDIKLAQLFNVLNMLWDGMIVNGTEQFKLFNEGRLTPEDAIKFVVFVDESHYLINTTEAAVPTVNYIEKFMREARKFFGGIFFVGHSINDFVPNYNSQMADEKAERVKKLFQLTQYKFIGQQDISVVPVLKSIFDGQVTDSELEDIPRFETGKVLLSISGVKNLTFNVDISQEELRLFGGGA